MMLELYVEQAGRRLRCGYTTGACAAAAAKAAAELLLSGCAPQTVSINTPKGVPLTLDVLKPSLVGGRATCAIQKDSGDDPDVTNGVLVYAAVEKRSSGIEIDGGEGVGRVTKPGLNQPVGAAAINAVPRTMIREACCEIAAAHGYAGGFSIVISIPAGVELAKRTFNPRLGIAEGISVIGTTGIVEPMSNAALINTIQLELSVLAAGGQKAALLTPGNYGEDFARDVLGLDVAQQVTCSNFIGEALDAAVRSGFQRILLIGHIGKLVKLGIGMMNTHSAYGDGRMETLAACALEAGAELPALRAVLGCVSTDAALAVLQETGMLAGTMAVLGGRIDAALNRRVPEGVETGFVCFTNAPGLRGVLAKSGNADELMERWKT
jgi:cobalt-precorrin-5B (C1)-methyltransferase